VIVLADVRACTVAFDHLPSLVTNATDRMIAKRQSHTHRASGTSRAGALHCVGVMRQDALPRFRGRQAT
jgi:hypothetical protein